MIKMPPLVPSRTWRTQPSLKDISLSLVTHIIEISKCTTKMASGKEWDNFTPTAQKLAKGLGLGAGDAWGINAMAALMDKVIETERSLVTTNNKPNHSGSGSSAGYSGTGDRPDLINHSNQLNPNNQNFQGGRGNGF